MVLHRNPAAAREFPGVAEGSLLTLALRNPALLSAIEAARRTGTAQSVELHQTVPNETWHRANVAPLPGGDGLLVVTLQSLTEQKRLEQLRSDFIANASHELRTPLTSLVGFIDTLLGPAAKDEAARERFLSIMRQQAARMSALIDDLLSLSRIEMRQHLRPTGTVDLAAAARARCATGFETQAARSRRRRSSIDGARRARSSPATANELYEVFENLIDNAIKYGGEGGAVEVAVGAGPRRLRLRRHRHRPRRRHRRRARAAADRALLPRRCGIEPQEEGHRASASPSSSTSSTATAAS